MELTQLKQFKAIADCGTMSAASESLYISQPALSISMHKLEKELGCQLFTRKKNHIALNDVGKIVLNSTDIILNVLEDMQRQIYEHIYQETPLRICSSYPAAMRYIIKEFLRTHPFTDVKTEYISRDAIPASLLDGKIDVAITTALIDHPEIHNVLVFSDTLYISAPENHPLAKKKSVTLAELTDCTFVRSREYGDVGKHFDKVIAERGIAIRQVIIDDNILIHELEKIRPTCIS